ncbi:MAG: TIR domain-containing protein [Actinobacteria bacterium]|nr:TIR domain-containing protein [Actinomycetota bacterium]
MFEIPDTLNSLQQMRVVEEGESPVPLLARAIAGSISEMPSRDMEASEILFGLTEAANGRRLGERRELAAKELNISAGTFRNRHEGRLIEELARRIAARLAPSGHVDASRVPITSEAALGFWSYVHEDDLGDGGRVLTLADDLRAQYRMRTAEDLVLFIDRESAKWGEKWKELISDAIAGTTFFIPIITPSYFRSNSCRQELLKFVREADKAGLERLLMPVYWITVPALEREGPDAEDEAIAAIARHQWRDLRDVRLEDRSSSVYRKSVSALAEEIAERASEVAETINDLPSASGQEDSPAKPRDDDGDDAPGHLERLIEGESAMESLTKLMAGFGEDIEVIGNMANEAAGELTQAASDGQGTKRALVITERFATEMSVPASRMQERGAEFARLLVLLDRGMQTQLDLIEASGSPDSDQRDSLRAIEEMAGTADQALDALQELIESIEPTAKLSRSLRAPIRQMKAGLQSVIDGRALMSEWGARARAMRPA